MAKKAYIGVGNLAKKGKKIYIGIDGKARKVKKAYIGVNGVARPWWGGGDLKYYGSLSGIMAKDLAATNNGTYALFGGGRTLNTNSFAVVAINSALTRTSAPNLSVGVYPSAARSGNYAIFAGLANGTVECYNTSLTKVTKSLSAERSGMGAATVNNYAVFAGGSGYSKTVEAFDTSLTRHTASQLSTGVLECRGTTVGNYALFGGGRTGETSATNFANAYNASLTRVNISALTGIRANCSAATVGNHAVFAGGFTSRGSSGEMMISTNTAVAYDGSLTKSMAPSLSHQRGDHVAVTIGDHMVVACGYTTEVRNGEDTGYVASPDETYDEGLTHRVLSSYYKAWAAAATTIGDYAIIGGGCYSTSPSRWYMFNENLGSREPPVGKANAYVLD